MRPLVHGLTALMIDVITITEGSLPLRRGADLVPNNSFQPVMFKFNRSFDGNIPPEFLELVFMNGFHFKSVVFANGVVNCFSNNIVIHRKVIA